MREASLQDVMLRRCGWANLYDLALASLLPKSHSDGLVLLHSAAS